MLTYHRTMLISIYKLINLGQKYSFSELFQNANTLEELERRQLLFHYAFFSYDLVRDEIRTFTENKVSPYKSSIFQNSLRKLDQKVKIF